MGDQNTKYFHVCANHRRKKNQILSVLNKHHNLVFSPPEILGVFDEYFQELFSSSQPSSSIMDECLSIVETKVTKTMNSQLTKPFTKEDIQAWIQTHIPMEKFDDCRTFNQRRSTMEHREQSKSANLEG